MATPAFAWSDDLSVGYEPMDEVHREFVVLVDSLMSCSDAELPQKLAEFAAHAQTHFGDEQAQMSASDFPPMPCHQREHEAVLKSVTEVQKRVAAGETEIARSLAAALADWFPEHAGYMDSALARWLIEKSSGGPAPDPAAYSHAEEHGCGASA